MLVVSSLLFNPLLSSFSSFSFVPTSYADESFFSSITKKVQNVVAAVPAMASSLANSTIPEPSASLGQWFAYLSNPIVYDIFQNATLTVFTQDKSIGSFTIALSSFLSPQGELDYRLKLIAGGEIPFEIFIHPDSVPQEHYELANDIFNALLSVKNPELLGQCLTYYLYIHTACEELKAKGVPKSVIDGFDSPLIRLLSDIYKYNLYDLSRFEVQLQNFMTYVNTLKAIESIQGLLAELLQKNVTPIELTADLLYPLDNVEKYGVKGTISKATRDYFRTLRHLFIGNVEKTGYAGLVNAYTKMADEIKRTGQTSPELLKNLMRVHMGISQFIEMDEKGTEQAMRMVPVIGNNLLAERIAGYDEARGLIYIPGKGIVETDLGNIYDVLSIFYFAGLVGRFAQGSEFIQSIVTPAEFAAFLNRFSICSMGTSLAAGAWIYASNFRNMSSQGKVVGGVMLGIGLLSMGRGINSMRPANTLSVNGAEVVGEQFRTLNMEQSANGTYVYENVAKQMVASRVTTTALNQGQTQLALPTLSELSKQEILSKTVVVAAAIAAAKTSQMKQDGSGPGRMGSHVPSPMGEDGGLGLGKLTINNESDDDDSPRGNPHTTGHTNDLSRENEDIGGQWGKSNSPNCDRILIEMNGRMISIEKIPESPYIMEMEPEMPNGIDLLLRFGNESDTPLDTITIHKIAYLLSQNGNIETFELFSDYDPNDDNLRGIYVPIKFRNEILDSYGKTIILEDVMTDFESVNWQEIEEIVKERIEVSGYIPALSKEGPFPDSFSISIIRKSSGDNIITEANILMRKMIEQIDPMNRMPDYSNPSKYCPWSFRVRNGGFKGGYYGMTIEYDSNLSMWEVSPEEINTLFASLVKMLQKANISIVPASVEIF
jgi:hypothetical protein